MQISFVFSGTYFPIGSRIAICDKPHWSLIWLLFGVHCTISVPIMSNSVAFCPKFSNDYYYYILLFLYRVFS